MSGALNMGRPAARGAVAIGHIDDLEAVEQTTVLALRLWCDGAATRAQVEDDLTAHLGGERARDALATWGALMGVIRDCGRRPLMRHGIDCKCLGADEACFAHFIATATTGAREDAMLIASLMVRADAAAMLTDLACQCGLMFHRMRGGPQRPAKTAMPHQTTLH